MVCVKNYHSIHTASTAVTTSFDTYALWRHEHFIDKYSKCNSCCLVMTKLHNDQIHSNVSNKLLTSISQIIICKYAWRVWKASAFSDGGKQSGLISPLAALPFNLACLWQSLNLSWALMAALSYPSSKQYAQHWWGSRAAATSKMERFVIIVNGFQPIAIIKKCSILDVAAALNCLCNMLLSFEFCFSLVCCL